MDKNAIKKYAVWARRELISRVSQKALQYGITENEIVDAAADSINGKLLTAEEKRQRKALIKRVNENGYEQVIEEVAYTWFNRFCALRFMEVNGYLPTHIRVLSDDENNFKPQILTEAINLDLPGLSLEKIYKLKSEDKNEELYKYLLITQCNALNSILPAMFQRISDYTELLFPDNLLREGSVVEQLVTQIPEDDWKDAVQIIGWLYQFYNIEPKDKVFEDLKKNIKIAKDKIPAATQLFTPDWIVRYMVENSLGRLWIEGHAESKIKGNWRYYLEEAEQEESVKVQLDKIRSEYAKIEPKDIRCIDPCMGSGHILVYMFDVLVQIYSDYGYNARDSVEMIIRNNLYGLDIDDRAAQLAYFAVMMKARQYDRRFLERGAQPQIFAIQESNNLSRETFDYIVNNNDKLRDDLQKVVDVFRDAKEYGSILQMPTIDFGVLYNRFDEIFCDVSLFQRDALESYLPLVKQAEILAQKYDIVVTNPPYMGGSSMTAKLSDYVKSNYSDSKADLFAVFIERCYSLTISNGFQAMITQHAWMFLSSFEKLREKLQFVDIVNMAHLGARAFEEIGGEVVQTTSFVMRKSHIKNYIGCYHRLVEPNSQQGKEEMFLLGLNRFLADQSNFSKIPSSPIAYWVMPSLFSTFDYGRVSSYAEARIGLATGRNDYYLRFWYELEFCNIGFNFSRKMAKESQYKWFPYNKGGSFRKWYGNRDYVINWLNDGYELQNTMHPDGHRVWAHNFNLDYIFKKNIAWSDINTGMMSFRVFEDGFLFDSSGTAAFVQDDEYYFMLGYLNTKIVNDLSKILNPTIHFTPGDFASLPYIKTDNLDILEKVQANIEICRTDWDSFETSWDFKKHPLLQHSVSRVVLDESKLGEGHWLIKNDFKMWEALCEQRFNQLKANEEELNRIFIEIYGLQDELTPEVEDKDITVRKADLLREIKSLISYAVGCMFGRYSIYEDGLIYAGGEFDFNSYINKAYEAQNRPDVKEFYGNIHFTPDQDNIIPICDDEYFADDIVGKFIDFIEIVYGSETLEENLRFIANALGGKGLSRDVIRDYFLNGFYADHLKVYQKRPIYWLFDSGKKNGFKALVYMHRYQPDTLARMRTDYVHEQQARYRTAIEDCNQRLLNANGSERVKLTKKLQTLTAQADEIAKFEEKLHHLADSMISIDLDDGVKRNYELFKDILAPIK